MNKILVIPLDERPCNVDYPKKLSLDSSSTVILPSKSLLGDKKSPADIDRLHSWIIENIKDVTHLIVSIDMLVYGGIVPSRLHHDPIEKLSARTNIIEQIKIQYPNIKIYAFNLIMRNPTYSSDDEEPTYYNDWGREIHLKGVYEHKKTLGILNDIEQVSLLEIDQRLPEEYYNDYTSRRRLNLEVNKKIIDYLVNGIVDFFIIPQDDASEFGLTKLDQQTVLDYIKEKDVTNNFLMYPDADAVVNSLLAKAMLDIEDKNINIYVEYAVEEASKMIPKFEDRALELSVPSQIEASGATLVEDVSSSDIVLMVNATTVMKDINASVEEKNSDEYTKVRNLDLFVDKIKKYLLKGLNVAIADIAYSNGSDIELIKRLQKENLLFKLSGYAAWNTSGNTLGTVIPMAIVNHLYGDTQSYFNFLAHRYVEDFLYMTMVRKDVSQNVLPQMNLNYFDVSTRRGKVSKIVYAKLQNLIAEYLESEYMITIKDCCMPWRRMFEVRVEVEAVKKFSLEDHTKFKVSQFKEENKRVQKGSVVLLGDSITEQLDEAQFKNDKIINRGFSGDNIPGILNRLETAIYNISPSKVVLLIGTNDMCNGSTNDEIVKGIKKITTTIQEFDSKIEIYVQSIYPIYELEHEKIVKDYIVCRSNARIKEINKQLSKLRKVTYIDMFKLLSNDGTNINIDYTTEGLHINELGYQVIVSELKRYL